MDPATPAGGGLAAALDVRPHGDDGGSWWVVSDLDHGRFRGQPQGVARRPRARVGQASLTLASATVRRPVGRLLDLGTGCGIQALHAARYAQRLVATDVNPRALALAEATFALSGWTWSCAAGRGWSRWPASVRPDRQQPAVRGRTAPRAAYVPRLGAGRRRVAARLVGALPGLLADGGVPSCWPAGCTCAARTGRSGWRPGFPEVRVDACRPARGRRPGPVRGHLAARLRDRPRLPAARHDAEQWLTWFDSHQVEGVGFGFITLRNTGSAAGRTEPTVLCEDLRQAMTDPLAWRQRAGWTRVACLRAHREDADLLDARLTLAPSVVLERAAPPAGWPRPALDRSAWRSRAAVSSSISGSAPWQAASMTPQLGPPRAPARASTRPHRGEHCCQPFSPAGRRARAPTEAPA